MSANRFSTEDLNFPAPKPAPVDPADANYSAAWNETIGALGFSAVVIQMERCPKSFEQTEFIVSLGEALHRVGLGHFDSSQWQPSIRHFFYVTSKRLPESLKFIRSGLKKNGLLKLSAIGYYDTPDNAWREFYPGIKGK